MKTILITGVSGGMGSAAAELFRKNGYHVIGIDYKENEVVSGVRFLKADLTDTEKVAQIFAVLKEEKTRIDLVLHMAGMYDLNSLVEMDEDAFARIFQVNLFAVANVNREVMPLLNKDARIMMITSELAPLDPLPFTGIYGITKSALERYAQALRMELQLIGIKVIILRPGAVDTGLLDVSTQKLEEFCRSTRLYRYNAQRFKRIVDRVESRKIPPERIATKALRAAESKHPRFVYTINRNPLLLLLNAFPQRTQCWIIKKIIQA